MSFQQGLSGLNTSAKNLDVIGNNIANSSTVGFKTSQAQFADVYAASLSGAGATQIGLGTKVATVVQQFTQGNISATNNPLDIAVNGGGFFRMDYNGSVTYTRNGQFQMDKDRYIVNASGAKLTGYGVDPTTGQIVRTNPVPILISSADLNPQATGASVNGTGVEVGLNLDSRAMQPASSAFSFSDPTSYNSSTSLTIYDTLGNPNVLSWYFVKTATPGVWDIHANVNNAPATVASYATVLAQVQAVDTGGAANVDVVRTAAVNSATWTGAVVPAAVTTAATTLASAIATADAAEAALVAAGASASRTQIDAAATATASVASAMASLNTAIQANSASVDGAGANPTLATTLSPNATTASAAASTAANVPAVTLAQTTLSFNTSGQLTTAMPFAVTVDLAGIAAAQGATNSAASPLVFNTNFTGSTQYGATFGVNTLTQDGYSSGRLSGFSAGSDGIILGRYSNGQSRNLGQVVLANFPNAQGLKPLGNNQWAESSESNQPLVGTPGSGALGLLQAAAVEESNVDLTAELVNMITAQRVYQANAQTIKTQDSVMQTLVNLR